MSGPSIPGYEHLELIGKGGFSRVYQAEQTKLKRQVAVKVLNFGLNDEADRRSFERETQLMGRVSTHPNIVTVHDTAFTVQGQPCIVMEHYRGGSLADLISEAGRLTPAEAIEVGVAIASALAASHHAGVLHCDLKPQNILISDFGQAALGDFGISTFAEERTRTGSDSGAGFTLAYAAPEIVEGASPAVTSDVYSLAATLYTGLAGRRPFSYTGPGNKKPTAAEQARRILLDDVASLVDEGVPAELDQIICDAMSKDPDVRPATAADFASALYDVGRQLGLGVSKPRTADRSSQTGLDVGRAQPAADPTPEPTSAAPVAPAEPAKLEPEPIDETATRQSSFDPSGDYTSLRADGTEAPAVTPAEAPGLPLDLTVPLAPAAPAIVEPATATQATGTQASASETFADVDLTELRATDSKIPLTPAPKPAAEPAPARERTEVSSSRRMLAPVLGGVSILIVALVLFLMTRGDAASNEPATATSTTTVTRTPAADPIIAPPRPSDVSTRWAGQDAVLVAWAGATSDADSVTYEIRRKDGTTSEVLRTAADAMIVDGLAANDTPCFAVLAVRSNRVSVESDVSCVGARGDRFAVISPSTCSARNCQPAIEVDGADLADATMRLETPHGEDVSDFLRVDAPTSDDEWPFGVAEETPPGQYVVLITAGGADYLAPLEVTE